MAANTDAAAETQVEGEEGAAKKKLPLKLIAMAAAGFLVVAGGGTGAYFMFAGKKKHDDEKAHAPIVKPIAFLDLPDVMVNLASPGSERTQYLKVKIVLELPEQAMAAQITPILPRVMDTFQTYLRELRPADLEGSAGLYRLKEELTRRVNAAIEPARVNAVLFKEMLVQ